MLITVEDDILVIDSAYWEHVCSSPFELVWTAARVRGMTLLSARSVPDVSRSASSASKTKHKSRVVRVLRHLLEALGIDTQYGAPTSEEWNAAAAAEFHSIRTTTAKAMQALHETAIRSTSAPCAMWPQDFAAQRQRDDEYNTAASTQTTTQTTNIYPPESEEITTAVGTHPSKRQRVPRIPRIPKIRKMPELCARLECFGWRSITAVSRRLGRDLFGHSTGAPTPWGVCEVEAQGDCFFGSLRRALMMAAHLDSLPTIADLRKLLADNIMARTPADYQHLASEYRLTAENLGGDVRLYAGFEIEPVASLPFFNNKTEAELWQLVDIYGSESSIRQLTPKQLLVYTLQTERPGDPHDWTRDEEGDKPWSQWSDLRSATLLDILMDYEIRPYRQRHYLRAELRKIPEAVLAEQMARRKALVEHVQTSRHYATSLDIGIIAQHYPNIHTLVLNSSYGESRLTRKLEKMGGAVRDGEDIPDRLDTAAVDKFVERQRLQFDLERSINNPLSIAVLNEAQANDQQYFAILLQTPGHFELVVNGDSPSSLYRWHELPDAFRATLLRLAT